MAIEPAYALAHGLAAMCHHNRFLRAGLREEDRAASVRHARLTLEYGCDDALALTFAGFCLGMDAHDQTAAFAAFETALVLSPSTALASIFGSVVHSWAAAAQPAIEWGERALRLSPFDSWAFGKNDRWRVVVKPSPAVTAMGRSAATNFPYPPVLVVLSFILLS